jgi:hypothetical protein
MTTSQPRSGRIGERGSAVVATLVLLAAALLVVAGARLFGREAVEQLRCQGDAVRAIGGGSSPGCGDGQRAALGGSRLHAGSGAQAASRGDETPPSGDREPSEPPDARDMLAPLFDIVKSVAEGAAENEVTEEEFDEVVSLYDDVREERTSIRHSKAATPYWDTIMADLARILQTLGGRELIEQLAHQTRWTLITIAFVRNEDGVPDPDRGLDATNGAAWYEDRVGYVEYAPGAPVALPGADLEQDPWAVLRSDVALYHELRHVLEVLAGTGDLGSIIEDGVELPAMEYQAVGLAEWRDRFMSENAYRAARRGIGAAGPGAAIGDADMPDRPRYLYRRRPADPPGPQPPPPDGDP